MADSIRVLLVGGTTDENETLAASFANAGLACIVCRDGSALADSLKAEGQAGVVVCSCKPSLAHALEMAAELKHERPYLPVMLYDESVHEVSRLRCIEHGMDDFVSRDELVEATRVYADLLGKASTDATFEDMKATPEAMQGQMYFQLNGDELSNALQFLCMTSREGRLSLKFASGRSGAVFLHAGTVSHAEFEDIEGLDALAKMLRGGAMEARFFTGRSPAKQTNSRPISQVLIEASVLADEGGDGMERG